MTQDTERLRCVTCVRVLHACARYSYSDIIVKISLFFWTCKYYLYICIVVLSHSFFDVLPPLFTFSFLWRDAPLPYRLTYWEWIYYHYVKFSESIAAWYVVRKHFLNGIYNNIMLDEKLILMVNLSKLVAVNEYLRERGDELVCIVLDSIVDSLRVALSNSKQK